MTLYIFIVLTLLSLFCTYLYSVVLSSICIYVHPLFQLQFSESALQIKWRLVELNLEYIMQMSNRKYTFAPIDQTCKLQFVLFEGIKDIDVAYSIKSEVRWQNGWIIWTCGWRQTRWQYPPMYSLINACARIRVTKKIYRPEMIIYPVPIIHYLYKSSFQQHLRIRSNVPVTLEKISWSPLWDGRQSVNGLI